MDQVIQNLWLGNITSIANVDNLKENNIHSILSTMKGRVVVQAVRVSRKDAQTLRPYHSDRPSLTNKSKLTTAKKRTSSVTSSHAYPSLKQKLTKAMAFSSIVKQE